MQPNDVRECAEMVARHPVIGLRYGSAIQYLRPAWLALLGCAAMIAAIFEEVTEAQTRTCAFGVGIFVSDDFVRELKTPPPFWFGPELATRVMNGTSPVLSDSQVREANSGEGLNELVWEALPFPEYATRSDVYHLMVNTYVESNRGFRFKELITSQMETVERLQWAIDAGGLFWDPIHARYNRTLTVSPEELVYEPHLIGITRELESGRLGSWVGNLFDYHPPRFGFSPSEQRLLLSALAGETGTDQELSQQLRVSLPTVKKMWLSIYRRIGDRMPELIPESATAEGEATERGKEKRRRILVYLRVHPEELRPVSAKFLKEQRARTRS
jgi:hypothetical protein